MNILVLCKKVPYPSKDGESIVIMKDIEILKKMGHSLHVACLNTEKHFVNTQNYTEKKTYWLSFFDKKINTSVSLGTILNSIYKRSPIHIVRFWDYTFLDALKLIVNQQRIDVILCQGLPMIWYADILKKEFKCKIVYRAHNIENKIWYDLAIHSTSFFKKYVYKCIGHSLVNYEKNKLDFCDSILTLNNIENNFFKHIYPQISCNEIAISLGDVHSNSKNFSTSKIKLLLTGSMDWKPNIEAASWFLNMVWPQISKEHFELTLAGKGIENWTKANNTLSDVKIIEKYESIIQLYETHDVLLVPLLSGAGIRIKILEAMQYGIPFIGSKIAIEGIVGIEDMGLDTFMQCWIDNINLMKDNPIYLNRIVQKNKNIYISNYSLEIILKKWQSVF